MSRTKPVHFLAIALALGVTACSSAAPGTSHGGSGGGDQSGGAGGQGGGGSGGKGGASSPGGAGGQMGGAGGQVGGAGGQVGGAGGRAGAGAPDASAAGGSGGRDAGAPDSAGSGSDANVAGLDKACTPKFTLKLTDTGPKGQIFLDAMGGSPAGVEQIVQQIGRDVCRVLYRRPEEVRAANEMELQINDVDGVAGKWGDLGSIGVEISTRHIQNVKNMGRDVAAEIKGILYHEMTHMYQHDDKPEGTFAGLANYYEAGAEAVRIRYHLAPEGCRPDNKSGKWQDHNYCSGGWWWLWVDTKYPDFIYKLNLQMKGRDGKAWTPADATAIAGRSLDELWTEYQGAACCKGTNTSCCK